MPTSKALHNNIQREVVGRNEFESFYHAEMIFNRYYEYYNNHRKHGALGRKSPEQYLRENDLISGPYKTEKKSRINYNFYPLLVQKLRRRYRQQNYN